MKWLNDTGEWSATLQETNAQVVCLLSSLTAQNAVPCSEAEMVSSQGRKDMGDRIQDIVVVTMSEFGRTAQLNAFKMIMASNQKHPAVSPLDPRGK